MTKLRIDMLVVQMFPMFSDTHFEVLFVTIPLLEVLVKLP